MFVQRMSLLLAGAWAILAANPSILFSPERTTIEAGGEPGNVLTVEAADQLGRPAWDVLRSVLLTNVPARVTDVWCGGRPQRFYRIWQRPASDRPFADNFRLLDQDGVSRELYYYVMAPEIKAFVLIFAANGCDDLEQRLPLIQDLQQKFASKGVVFWMINSNPADTRTGIAAEAKRLGITFPVLHDRAQTVARLYRISKAAEVVCINRETTEVIYRGALDDGELAAEGLAPNQNLVEAALTAFLEGRTPPIVQTKPDGCDISLPPPQEAAYSTTIAPLLQAKCVSCHSPGNVAPWAMTNHAIVQAYAPLIKQEVMAKRMPPWHADPEYGRFKNDISLSPEQERTLIDWILAGAPRGSGSDPLTNIPAAPPRWPAELGEPDLILRPPVQQVMANGIEPYRYIFVDTGLTEDKWLRAAIVKPTNRRVVHHYLVWEGRSMEEMASGLAGYVPGMQDVPFPPNTGAALPREGSVTFNLHYTPSGEPATDQPELALWFHKSQPEKVIASLPLLDQSFVIPARARDHRVTATPPAVFNPLPVSLTLYALAPHMHFRGKSMRFEVEYPDGTRETLLNVPNYDFNWQTRYQLVEPKVLPVGTKVWITGSFDNSELNPANPDPNSSVRWGEQSFEEMFIGYFDVTL